MNAKLPTPRGRKGLALADVMIAAGIMAFGLLPVLNLATAGLRETAMTGEDILVRNVALDVLERYDGEDLVTLEQFSSDTGNGGQPVDVVTDDPVLAAGSDSGPQSAVTHSGEQLAVKAALDFEKDGGGKPGLHRLTVRVSFTSHGRAERTFVLHRLLYRPDTSSRLATAPSTAPTGA